MMYKALAQKWRSGLPIHLLDKLLAESSTLNSKGKTTPKLTSALVIDFLGSHVAASMNLECLGSLGPLVEACMRYSKSQLVQKMFSQVT